MFVLPRPPRIFGIFVYKNMEINCLRCNKTVKIYKSQIGRKKYCSKECFNPERKPIQKRCLQCQKEISCPPSLQDRKKFCSVLCHNTYNARKQTQKATIDRVCPICNKTFQTKQQHGGRKTCSKVCSIKSASETNSKKDSKITKQCQICGEMFSYFPCRNKVVCSRKCQKSLTSIRQTGTIRAAYVNIKCANCGKELRRKESRTKNYKRQFCGKKCYHAWDSVYKSTEEWISKSRPTISGIENIVAFWMDGNNISYNRQHPINHYKIDFLVNENTVVEVNGCYWHGCISCFPGKQEDRQTKRRSRDKALNTYCRNRNIPILTIWEHSIRKKDFSALDILIHSTPND